jgi:uncharacterized protein (DUF305 family)
MEKENSMESSHSKQTNTMMEKSHYKKLAVMAVLSFVSMYILMYSMVNKFENVVTNTNQFYMAGLMAMPMVIIEVLIMSSMYMNKKLNAIIIGLSLLALVGFYTAIRQQTAINDKQFLKSMIPHHAGAILMCTQADITDPEIKKLCEEIVKSQKKEIAEMKSKLEELKE